MLIFSSRYSQRAGYCPWRDKICVMLGAYKLAWLIASIHTMALLPTVFPHHCKSCMRHNIFILSYPMLPV